MYSKKAQDLYVQLIERMLVYRPTVAYRLETEHSVKSIQDEV